MKIYTAATFAEQARIRGYKESLIQMGHQITSSWLEESLFVRPEGMPEEVFERKMAMKDLQEVSMADCFVLDVENPSRTAGKMVECGFALAKHKLIYIVGIPPQHSIFLLLADKQFDNWEELFEYFKLNHKVEGH